MSEAGKVVHALGGQPYDVYVGRTLPRWGLKDEGWGNPYRPVHDGDLETVLRKHERRMRKLPRLRRGRGARGTDRFPPRQDAGVLVRAEGRAWCAPKGEPLTLGDPVVCHGQTLLKLAEESAGGE